MLIWIQGTATVTNSTLVISNATAVHMFFDAETSYRFAGQAEWEAEVARKVDRAYTEGYAQVRADAVRDSSGLLGRVALDLGASPGGLADLPTDQRIARARTSAGDTQLATLVFNYGRHLLAASSRPASSSSSSSRGSRGTSLPANLQGLWNNSTSAPWGGKYTININIQMNYWPAGPTNLIETQEPLFDLMGAARARGGSYARRMYGCPGTVFHHNLDLWGDPAPTDNYTQATLWPAGAAWLSWHMMDHYRFTRDKAFLRDVAYPFLADVAAFFECYCMEYDGYNATGPSLSPENSFYVPDGWSVPGAKEPVDIGPAMDGQLIGEAVESLLEAAEILGIADDDDTVAAAREFLPTILPQRVGSLGQILEWRQEYKEPSVGQKHLSPLVGLMPGRQFSPLLNATMGSAAEVLLRRRVSAGSGTTGWSRTWLINSFARVFDGDGAWDQLTKWFQKFPTPYNLYNTDAGSPEYVFQIDGNFGFVSGVTEMLLQSHADVVHLLPALPSAVPTGSVKGLVARGNFVVDIAWDGGAMTSANITSRAGAELAIRYMNGSQIAVDGEAYTGPLATTTGTTYVVTPS